MLYLTIIGGAFITWLILAVLFTPHIPYHIEAEIDACSDHFLHVLESTCQTHLDEGNHVEILTDGDMFYPTMLEAIRNARETINMECYIFKKGDIGDAFIDALCDRAKAGVRVTIVMDAIGSFGAFRTSKKPLEAAGCRVAAYQPFTWYRLSRLNNRTHRELLVVDGTVAFVGGAGVADWWAKPTRGKPMWRDMMARIEGPVVSDIAGVLAENWVECCGEILTSPETYKGRHKVGSVAAFAVKSSPADRSTVSRVLFQTLVEAASAKVRVSTPYFLPDKAFRQAIQRTVTRGVDMTVIVPGTHTDQRWVRLASRRMYGQMLEAGVRIFEYERGMTHVKTLLVDDLWAVIGTTNLDNRSFEHNDEVNVAIRDAGVSARLMQDFDRDLSGSREITLRDWRRRPLWEKLIGSIAWILERQQ
ncbi:MAG: cardiolipin synthase [Acidobacteria bacterium 13_1_40CM_4_65_8]|nr:MAG: cardiolipin synthase [Acidobacteria bacterium 13_1_40CM_4_65_8]